MSLNYADDYGPEEPGLIDRISDWMNPILVKESRQALKSRQFVVTFMLLLLVAWGISTFGMVANFNRLEFSPLSAWFFQAFYFCLTVATYIVVPFGAYRSLLSEQEQQTYEVLSITSLSPRQIVWGKLLNALTQNFIFYAAVSPFVAFSALLQGFDLIRVSYLLIIALVISMMASMTALMLSTISRQKHWQALTVLSVFGMLSALFFWSAGLSTMFIGAQFPLEEEFWFGNLCLLIALASYFFLFQQITVAQMTFDSGNKSSGVRIIATIQFTLFWAFIIFGTIFWGASSFEEGLMMFGVSLSAIHCGLFGLFAVAEPDFLSRRIRRSIPASGLARLFYVPFYPGGARGYLYAILHAVVLCAIPLICNTLLPVDRFDRVLMSTLAMSAYIVIFLGLGCWTSRLMYKMASDVKPAHGRVLVGLYLAAGSIIPILLRLVLNFILDRTAISTWDYAVYDIMSPIATLNEITGSRSGGNNATWIVPMLGIFALIAIALNARALWRSVAEIVGAPQSKPSADDDGVSTDATGTLRRPDAALES